MSDSSTFAPDWASPPGDTLQEAMRDRGLTLELVAAKGEIALDDLRAVLDGRGEITIDIARGLSASIGASPRFWVNRECQYREDLERRDLSAWVDDLPTKQMIELGWIPAPRSPGELVRLCLDFFQVADLTTWDSKRASFELARYRSSRSFTLDDMAAATWLQQALRNSRDLSVSSLWGPDRLTSRLRQIRAISRKKNPQEFVPHLQELLGRCGVRFVVVPPPTGCPISGASLRLDDGTALVALTARHLADDHLWFTLFHELGHLLLHHELTVFVDNDDASDDDLEREADDFAVRHLLPVELIDELPSHRTPTSREIIRAAMHHSVAPGIVVGHLQHTERLGYQNLNSLKRRYCWRGPSLETA